MDARRPADPVHPRYTHRPFPPYRFVPGLNPHPRRDPQGHSYGQAEPVLAKIVAERWFDSEDYLYAMDLFNHGYWWESHEVFEALWHAAGHTTMEGQFFRALIQLAAANLKRSVGAAGPSRRLQERALLRLGRFSVPFMGLDVPALTESIRTLHEGTDHGPVTISLTLPKKA